MGSLLGAGIGLVGSFLGQKSQNSALKKAAKAAAFNPWNVSGFGGSASFDPKSRTATYALDPIGAALSGKFSNAAMGFLNGGYSSSILPFTQGIAGSLPELFSGMLDASAVDPGMLERLQSVLNPEIANQQGAAAGLFDLAQNYLGGNGLGMDEARSLFGLGTGMLGERPTQTYQDVAAQRTSLLRDLASPYETRAREDMFSRLHSMGMLTGPAGQRAMQEFGAGLGEADLKRVLAGQDLAEGIYGRDLQAALARNQLGAGLAQGGMEGLFRGAGMGLDAAQLGLGASLNAANLGQMGYGAEGMFSDLVNSRALQRFTNARDMFGFGMDLQSAELQNAIASLGGYQNLVNQGQSFLQLGSDLGARGAQAGANQAQYLSQVRSPWAGVLQGIGMGMMGGGGGMPGMGSTMGSMFSTLGGQATNLFTNWMQNAALKRSMTPSYGGITIAPNANIWGPSGPPVFNFGGT